jgi:hypothetical protein
MVTCLAQGLHDIHDIRFQRIFKLHTNNQKPTQKPKKIHLEQLILPLGRSQLFLFRKKNASG